MSRMSCFSALLAGKRKILKVTSKIVYGKKASGKEFQKVKPVEFVVEETDTVDIVKGGDDDIGSACDTKLVAFNATELASESRDKDDDEVSVKKDPSDVVDLVAGDGGSGSADDSSGDSSDGVDKEAAGVGLMMPPAMAPRLERSCSNIETTARCCLEAFVDLPAKSLSYGDLNALPAAAAAAGEMVDASPAASVKTCRSADHVMLKRCSSSSQMLLPSHSRNLWWRLLLQTHRNPHQPVEQKNHGYASDTLDVATMADAKKKGIAVEQEPMSPVDRVSAWVNSLGDTSFINACDEDVVENDDDDGDDGGVARLHCTEIGEPSSFGGGKGAAAHARRRVIGGEAIKASSPVAQVSGMGLTVIPVISPFSGLRAVNLSGNLIVRISSGSLPKGLHSLDLSRNKISTIEGLRELTRLRVLNLSYNKISRIGNGLSNCGAIRELYLAGNKISEVEGLHRLLKLAMLDLSFNKITTTKALNLLVANYNTLRALNLVGNPVQANTGDDALRKAVSGLLSRLAYLNKQPVVRSSSLQRAQREAAKDHRVEKAAALGVNSGGWRSHCRRTASAKNRGRDGSGSQRGSRSRSKSRPHHH
uniref:U2A'/phosphoprotein 32 family A C-terminal domain-containing protein n=1 Tax=Leersia perrieri TaxID=77586 RepID=A0A0D9VQK0_9ORYZ